VSLTSEQILERRSFEKFPEHFLGISENEGTGKVWIKLIPVTPFSARHLKAILAILIINTPLFL
jgi:hypothetical protein